MGNKMTLQDTIDLATFAHRHQYDKAGEPYIKHPLRVLAGLQARGARPYVQMAGVLHDVTEDTPFTSQMLLDLGVPEAAVDIVRLVDRDYSKAKYLRLMEQREQVHTTWKDDFTDPELSRMMAAWDVMNLGSEHASAEDFYYWEIRNNPEAVEVKEEDIGDNTRPWRLVYLPQETQARLTVKYDKALKALR